MMIHHELNCCCGGGGWYPRRKKLCCCCGGGWYPERKDLTEKLKNKGYNISKIIDLSSYEKKKQYLEGTGSMILDRKNKICYAALSKRTNEIVLNQLCKLINYKLLKFKQEI
jgi:hypothetical protein